MPIRSYNEVIETSRESKEIRELESETSAILAAAACA